MCSEWRRHHRLEQELFYARLPQHGPAAEPVRQAAIEHRIVDQLMDELVVMSVQDEVYRATLTVLGEYIAHHIAEDERTLFPLARALDPIELSVHLQARQKHARTQAEEAPDWAPRTKDGRLDVGTVGTAEDRNPPLP